LIAVLKVQYVNTHHMVDILEWKGTSATHKAVILDWTVTSSASLVEMNFIVSYGWYPTVKYIGEEREVIIVKKVANKD
jgi:hypothetical protein